MALKSYLSAINKPLEVSFASPSYGFGKWDFKLLADNSDYLFVMNYDYYGSWSSTTGPSSPFTGTFLSVANSILNEYGNVPCEKIILGLPYYGNHWKVKSDQPYAAVIPFNSDSTTNDWQKIILYRDVVPQLLQYQKLWDSISQTPWIRWNDNGWNQVWFDDSSSLEIKYNFAIATKLKGIGIWALGYDGDRPELWNLISKKFTGPTSVEQKEEIPAEFELYQNYPNPFNPSTVIKYYLQMPNHVILKVHDLLGREVGILVDEFQNPGTYSAEFSVLNFKFASNLYFYTLSVGNRSSTKVMTVLK
jgi:hypothetical protein